MSKTITTIEELANMYYKYILGGYNTTDAAREATYFIGANKPCIYNDEDGMPSHVFFDNSVLFFSDVEVYREDTGINKRLHFTPDKYQLSLW